MTKRGFTLIEIMTAVSIFAVVMTISMGAILQVFNTNRKSEALKAVMDNLNLTVESMSREIRFGRDYDCGAEGGDTNCSGSEDTMRFTASDGREIVYELADGTIYKSTDGGAGFLPVTAAEIEISDLSFYVLGTLAGDALQPKVIIKIKGTAGVKDVDETDFTLQTLVSQRQLDI